MSGSSARGQADAAAGSEALLDSLLEFVRETRGLDCTDYKQASVERRVARRMAHLGVESYAQYIDHLRLDPSEFAELFNALLLNATSFFRDPHVWEYLAAEVIPALVASRSPSAPLRVWCPGSGSGEEAYTVAMVMARVLGDAAFLDRVKIYATDIDEEALDTARRGAYLPRQVAEIPADALDRFFEHTGPRYMFRSDFRRNLIFGRNDLLRDAPIGRIDLLACRNTLVYFPAETQAQILGRFHFALDDGGALLLGKSELLIARADLFTPVDLKARLFRKVSFRALRDRVELTALNSGNGLSPTAVDALREAAFNVSTVAQIVLNADGALLLANDAARRALNLGFNDFGRPLQDLALSFQLLGLRGHLDTVARERRGIDVTGVRWRSGGRDRILDIRLTPLMNDRQLRGTSVSFVDVTDTRQLREELSEAQLELETTYEKLQSTVEELETTNEELLSTNEELGAMNEELSRQTLALNGVNKFLERVLAASGLALAVVDRREHVQLWNGRASELWGLTAEEVEDRHVMSLDFGLPVEQLEPALRECLTGGSEREELTMTATNGHGTSFTCKATCMPLGNHSNGEVSGAVILMEPIVA